MSNHIRPVTFAFALSATISFVGCGSSPGDAAGAKVTEGITQARQGLEFVQNNTGGSATVETDAGDADVIRGMGMMTTGTDDVETGLDMMPNGMMSGCCKNRNEVIIPLRDAVIQIKKGRDQLTDENSSNDSDGAKEFESGCNAMSDALDFAASVMKCMGHGSMSSMMY
jgi:hypothetical protein